jgi:hypothetical protein
MRDFRCFGRIEAGYRLRSIKHRVLGKADKNKRFLKLTIVSNATGLITIKLVVAHA